MAAIETFRGVVFPWLADHLGHLTTSRYVEMFDVGAYHLFHALGQPILPGGTHGWVDVRQVITYRAETPIGALVVIRSGFTAIGTSSITAHHRMWNADGDVLHAELEAKTVFFDMRARRSAPLPDAVRARAGELIDPQAESATP